MEALTWKNVKGDDGKAWWWWKAAKEARAFELGDALFYTSSRSNRFTFSSGASQKKWVGGEASVCGSVTQTRDSSNILNAILKKKTFQLSCPNCQRWGDGRLGAASGRFFWGLEKWRFLEENLRKPVSQDAVSTNRNEKIEKTPECSVTLEIFPK